MSVGVCGKKTENSDGPLRETEVCYLTCSEGFRYRATGDQHQRSEEGSRRMACRCRRTGYYLVNRGRFSMVGKEKNVFEG